jgi:hypothetical protein
MAGFGMFAYSLVAGILSPVMVTGDLDSPDTIALAIADVDRKTNSVIPGSVIDDASPETAHWFTYAQIARGARKAQTPVVIGRPVDITRQTKAFQRQIAALTPRTLTSIVSADWRLDNEQFSSNELDTIAAALVENYAQ